jgi:hypothetical protein
MSKTNKKIREIAEHIKESMCIDGEVLYLTETEIPFMIKTKSVGNVILSGLVFECIDSKRGTFFVGWFKGEKDE